MSGSVPGTGNATVNKKENKTLCPQGAYVHSFNKFFVVVTSTTYLLFFLLLISEKF